MVTSQQAIIVLLADDNIDSCEMLSEYLQALGYQIMLAYNGKEAIQRVEEQPPNVILMDIQMPVMDGLEAIRHLKADPRFVNIPIIALTALAMRGDRERCLEAGADEYLSKPVNLKMMVNLIDSLQAR